MEDHQAAPGPPILRRPWFWGGLAIVAVIVVVGWANYIALSEAYGYGPPHYGRTTNMDKWSDPLPRLLVINGIAAAIVLGIVLLIRRHGAKRRNA